jgi:hypothetical protein
LTLPFSRRTIVCAAVIGAIILGLLGGRAVSSRLAAARAVEQVALDQAVVAQKHADAADKFAAAQKDSADAAKRAGAIAQARADSAQHAADHYRGAFSQLAKVAPDTCKPVIVIADSALAADSVTIAGLRNVIASDTAAIRHLEYSRDSLRVALTQMETAGKNLAKASIQLVKASKTPFWLRILPKPSLGCAAGLDPHNGRPASACGITAGWSL